MVRNPLKESTVHRDKTVLRARSGKIALVWICAAFVLMTLFLNTQVVRVPAIVSWIGTIKAGVSNEPLHMVDLMPTFLTLAGESASSGQPFDGKDAWGTFADGKASPHEDILINAEFFRGAIRKGQWKLVTLATLPGKTELFDISKDPGEKTNVADQFPEVVADLEARLIAYAREKKTSEWLKAQRLFMGEQGKTAFDPGFDVSDGGLPNEKPVLPVTQ